MKSVCQVKSFKTLRGCFQPSGGEAPPGPTKPPPPMWSPSPDSSRQLESLHPKVDLFTEVLFLQQDESQSRTSAVSKHWSFHGSKQSKQGNHMYSHLSTKTDQAGKSVIWNLFGTLKSKQAELPCSMSLISEPRWSWVLVEILEPGVCDLQE